MISFRGKERRGMSVALQAMRYPYNTRSTLSWAIIRRSSCSRSSSRMIGSSRTAKSWYDLASFKSASSKLQGIYYLPLPADIDDDRDLLRVS